MRPIHEERMLTMLNDNWNRIATRRGVLRGSAIAGGGALALAASGRAVFGQVATPGAPGAADALPIDSPDSPFADEVEVLNYALTLEHLEATFYREGIAQFVAADFEALGFQASVLDYVVEIGAHEQTHVDTLIEVITGLGGTPVEQGTYDFGYADLTGFLGVAAALENTGVGAYTGAAQYLMGNDDLLTAALTIHGVEARHASYLNIVTDAASPFPEAFETPLTPAEVLEIATPFFVTEATPVA